MPDLSSVSIDLTGRELVEETPRHRMWRDVSGGFMKVSVAPGGAGWPFDLREPARAIDFYGRQCREQFKGVMLEMDVVDCAGHTALCGLFKYRSPVPGSLAMMFVSILWLPFRDWTAQVNVEAVERGTTGMREAAVMAMAGAPADVPQSEPVQVSSLEDMFEKMRGQPLRVLAADDAKYDASFPDHPLSQVRVQMAAIVAGLGVNEPTEACVPYRFEAVAAPVPVPVPAAAPAGKPPRPWWRIW